MVMKKKGCHRSAEGMERKGLLNVGPEGQTRKDDALKARRYTSSDKALGPEKVKGLRSRN